MKNKAVLIGLVLATLSVNLNAEGYVGIGYSKSADSGDRILGIKASELAGNGGAYGSLQFGLYRQPEMGAKAFLEIWANRQKINWNRYCKFGTYLDPFSLFGYL